MLTFHYDLQWNPVAAERSIWRYRELLPVGDARRIVTLGEGMTPLIKAGPELHPHVYLKDETRNPTGSMKDRAMSVAYSKAAEWNVRRSILTSAGGLGIAASAYAARAGIRNTIFIPLGVNEDRKMAMQIYGSELIEIDGNIEDCLELVEQLEEREGLYQTTSYRKGNPYTSEGPKTIAYELYEQLSPTPDFIVVPVGGGGTLSGIWRGYRELQAMGRIDRLPRMIAVQNTKFNALEIALQRGYTTDEQLHEAAAEIDSSLPTVTASIKHSYVPDGVEALEAIRDSGGDVISVSDEEAMAGQRRIAAMCGLFVEPSSAITAVALRKAIELGIVQPHHAVVLLLTGSGYREMTATTKYHGTPPLRLTPEQAYRHVAESGSGDA